MRDSEVRRAEALSRDLQTTASQLQLTQVQLEQSENERSKLVRELQQLSHQKALAEMARESARAQVESLLAQAKDSQRASGAQGVNIQDEVEKLRASHAASLARMREERDMIHAQMLAMEEGKDTLISALRKQLATVESTHRSDIAARDRHALQLAEDCALLRSQLSEANGASLDVQRMQRALDQARSEIAAAKAEIAVRAGVFVIV